MKRLIAVCATIFFLVAMLTIPRTGDAAGEGKEITIQCWKCKETFKAPASAASGQCPRCGAKYAIKPSSSTPKSEPTVISWEDAASYVGKNKTVEGVIVGSHISEQNGNLYLNFSTEFWATLSIQIPSFNLKQFRSDAVSFYQGKKIRARGLIKRERNYLRIVVTNPDDLKVID